MVKRQMGERNVRQLIVSNCGDVVDDDDDNDDDVLESLSLQFSRYTVIRMIRWENPPLKGSGDNVRGLSHGGAVLVADFVKKK